MKNFAKFSIFRFIILSGLFLLIQPFGFAQQNQKPGKISGKLLDKVSKEPIPFGSIAIYSLQDSLIDGAVSGEKGEFELQMAFGTYYGLIEFMGFESKKTENFSLSAQQPNVNLGEILIESIASELNEVTVQALALT
jgi:hypothetical protein